MNICFLTRLKSETVRVIERRRLSEDQAANWKHQVGIELTLALISDLFHPLFGGHMKEATLTSCVNSISLSLALDLVAKRIQNRLELI